MMLKVIQNFFYPSADGFSYTQEMYNMFFYWQQMLEIELARESGVAER